MTNPAFFAGLVRWLVVISCLIRSERGSQRSFTDEMGLELFALGAFGQPLFQIMYAGAATYESGVL